MFILYNVNGNLIISILERTFPFIGWFKGYTTGHLRIDFISGLTVALVLIPQSMAYAQLAGLPPYYGLYAAFIPPLIAALFGSSKQLATGPVAVVIPLQGFSSVGGQGRQFHDPEADSMFARVVKEAVKGDIKILEVDAHINDSSFADRVADTFSAISPRGGA